MKSIKFLLSKISILLISSILVKVNSTNNQTNNETIINTEFTNQTQIPNITNNNSTLQQEANMELISTNNKKENNLKFLEEKTEELNIKNNNNNTNSDKELNKTQAIKNLTNFTNANNLEPLDIKPLEIMQKKREKTFMDGLISGFSIVFFAEVGDRTFILIMIYSISNNYFKTFLIANLVLLSWNLLSILIGLNMQYYINRTFVEWFGIGLFMIFGIHMIYEAIQMEGKLVEEEFAEEEENLRKNAEKKILSNDNNNNNEQSSSVEFLKNENNLGEKLLNKNEENNDNKKSNNLFNSFWAFGFALLMAEFGDKSQIAAIIIGATLNLFGVIIGTSLAHMICSVIAIVFGRIFSHYITNRQITMIGGIIFLLFSLLFLIEKL